MKFLYEMGCIGRKICPDCRKNIPDYHVTCPHCGYNPPIFGGFLTNEEAKKIIEAIFL